MTTTIIRSLFKSDLPQILTIEKSVHPVPWSEETFKSCFQPECFGWVIELNESIIAFIIVTLHMGECHVLNVSVAREYQKQGFGKKLMETALNHAKQNGAGIIYLEVRRSNQSAISLYRKMNFHLIGERKNYYPTLVGTEDALVFAKTLREY